MVSTIWSFTCTWLFCKKKYKTLLIKYKHDKRSNCIFYNDNDERVCFEQVDLRNGICVNVVNHMPTSAMEENKIKGVHNHFKILAMQPQPKLNDQNIKEKIQKKLEFCSEQMVNKFHKFDYKFLTLLQNMDVHMATLIQKL